MGLDLDCGPKNFNIGYGHWHDFRTDTIRATKQYICDLIHNNSNKIPCIENIKNLSISESDLINMFDTDLKTALVAIGLEGLYDFCNKADSDTYYTAKESRRICKLFDIVWQNNPNKHPYVDVVYEVFKYSAEKGVAVDVT